MWSGPRRISRLNRIATVTENGLEHEADRRHAETLMRNAGVDDGCRGSRDAGSEHN